MLFPHPPLGSCLVLQSQSQSQLGRHLGLLGHPFNCQTLPPFSLRGYLSGQLRVFYCFLATTSFSVQRPLMKPYCRIVAFPRSQLSCLFVHRQTNCRDRGQRGGRVESVPARENGSPTALSPGGRRHLASLATSQFPSQPAPARCPEPSSVWLAPSSCSSS